LLALIICTVDSLTINLFEFINLATNAHIFLFGLVELLVVFLDF
jgi:hypothetical protein